MDTPSAPQPAPPASRDSRPSAGASASHSRHVRKLSHRPPVPRSIPGRAAQWVSRGARLPLVLVAALALVPAAFLFPGFLSDSEYFQLAEIEIVGHKRLGEGTLRAVLREKTGVEEGVTTLRVDTAAVGAALDELPEVAAVHVRKRWPDALEIVVDERQPAGIYVSSTGTFVFDAEGLLFAEATLADLRARDLPVLTGLTAESPGKGSRLPAAARERLAEYERAFSAAAPELWAQRSELRYEPDTGVTLVMADGARFLCGHRPAAEVGPVIEALLSGGPARPRIIEASLPSELYATVTRAPAAVPVLAAGVASSQ